MSKGAVDNGNHDQHHHRIQPLQAESARQGSDSVCTCDAVGPKDEYNTNLLGIITYTVPYERILRIKLFALLQALLILSTMSLDLCGYSTKELFRHFFLFPLWTSRMSARRKIVVALRPAVRGVVIPRVR